MKVNNIQQEKQREEISPAVAYLNNIFKHVDCDHVWQYDGHGHNDAHYICRKCGSEGDY